MPDQKIDDVITSIEGFLALVRNMLVEINKLKADQAILENEIESYKADKSEWLDKRQAAAYRRLMDEMETESGANR